MSEIHIVVGSVFGAAISVADDVIEWLEAAQVTVQRDEAPDAAALASDLVAKPPDLLLVITSTTGNGDLPDDLQPFYATLRNTPPAIAGLKYAVIVLGDSSYETFCGGGLALDEALLDIGATRVAEPLLIDAMESDEPEIEALAYVKSLPGELFN